MRSALARVSTSPRIDLGILLAVIVALSLAGFLSVTLLHAKPAAAVTTPPGFTNTTVASVGSPTALAFTPDERLLVATQNGRLWVYDNGALLTQPALDISGRICSNRERGVLGVAVDPGFKANHYIYLYYTYNKSGRCPEMDPSNPNNPVNRVSRFIMSGDSIDPSTEEVLIDNIPSFGVHNAGDLYFGKDGYLYISVGDGGCDYAGDSGCQSVNDAARDRNVLLGKILRITRDGDIPANNPYTGTNSAPCSDTGRTDVGKKCQEIFASGLRNPFRFAFDPNASSTRFFINDVGVRQWEEVDQGRKGADYAWNLCEGNHDNPGRSGSVDCLSAPYTPPIHEYSHDTGCSAITGGAFVPNGFWPASYDDSYLYGDYRCGKIFKLTPDGAGGFEPRTEFVTDLGGSSATAMTFGPHQGGKALYYTTYGNGGEVHRIAYSDNANRPPTAALAANPTSGVLPLAVSFDGSKSVDPDEDDTLTSYLWDFGDGSGTEITTPTTSHTYSTKGTYTASLRVRDNNGAISEPATLRIDAGNIAPTPVIESPSADLAFSVGQEITLSGSATDPEDGALPGGSFRWEVLQHHDGTHTHPFLSETGNDLTFTAPMPEDLGSTGAGNYLEIRLTTTDSEGLSKTVTQRLRPNRVNVAFETNPAQVGLQLQLNEIKFAAPRTLVSWEGYKLTVNAPSPQTHSGTTYMFSSWSDGNRQKHNIVTRATSKTYTANFKACTITGTSGADILAGTSGADVICGMDGNDTIKGMAGSDVLFGGDGADKVTGAGGADDLYGEVGNDTVNSRDGVSGNDSLNGGPGTDTKVTDAAEWSIVGFP